MNIWSISFYEYIKFISSSLQVAVIINMDWTGLQKKKDKMDKVSLQFSINYLNKILDSWLKFFLN